MKKVKIIGIIVGIMVIGWLIHRSELMMGICLNMSGDGHLYNGESYYNYISYKGTGAGPDDIVVTYDLLNPFNLADDDILIRHDMIIGRWYGKAR
jgi:hypothetical protein